MSPVESAYPSSVLMNVVPAKVAGVSEIIMTTPPSAEGKVNPAPWWQLILQAWIPFIS